MKVEELRKELKDVAGDMPVYVYDLDCSFGFEVTSVDLVENEDGWQFLININENK